ncbi:MAG: 30S ribosomal protein S2 [Candidatus Pacebacteria bacterium]|nr:30S ribosomal protein S2 [Candidatus Paceibacterota bacterium]
MKDAEKKKKQSDTEPLEEAKEEKKTESSSNFGIKVEDMAREGLHFGHKTSKVHPKMKPYLFGVRNSIYIIDLEKTAEKLKEALKFIQDLISEKKVILLVGTKIQTKDMVKDVAKECDLPCVSERWLGGTFTNFENVRKRVEYFKDLENKKTTGELEKYTKKERANFDKELKKLELKFGGIRNLTQFPDAIFVLDVKKDVLAVKEAKAKGVKIIGLSDTSSDPTILDYPIPANDDAISSIKYILDKVKETILKAKSKVKTEK